MFATVAVSIWHFSSLSSRFGATLPVYVKCHCPSVPIIGCHSRLHTHELDINENKFN